jgi:NADPH2:quinone reductase
MDVKAGDTVLVQGGAAVSAMSPSRSPCRAARGLRHGFGRAAGRDRRLGAIFIDRHEPVADYVARLTAGEGFDRVYDTVGGVGLDASFQAVRRFGHVVSCLGWGAHALAPLSFKGPAIRACSP